MYEIQPKPVGRPPNPTNPIEAHKSEILKWVEVTKRARQLLEKQLVFFEKQLGNADTGTSTLSMEGMLQVMSGLGTLVLTSTKVVDQGLKTLDKPSPGGKDAEDPEEIMDALKGGRG